MNKALRGHAYREMSIPIRDGSRRFQPNGKRMVARDIMFGGALSAGATNRG